MPRMKRKHRGDDDEERGGNPRDSGPQKPQPADDEDKEAQVDDEEEEEQEERTDGMSVSQKILVALQTQNDLLRGIGNELKVLKSIDTGLKEALKTQTNLLKNVVGKLERPNRDIPRQRQNPAQASVGTVPGSWKFVETPSVISQKRTSKNYKNAYNNATASYGLPDKDGRVLQGEGFGYSCPQHPSNSYTLYLGSHAGAFVPSWASSIRFNLPQCLFNDKADILQKSGIYDLRIRYNQPPECQEMKGNVAIIIGEIEFNNSGYVIAEGVDWDRLLNGQRQTQLPYSHGARGVPIWMSRKISEPWKNGEELKFRIDTNENTIVFQRGNTPPKTLWNILAFSNNRKYPDYLHVYAFCGGWEVNVSDKTLTILSEE